jgi:hypothetical protein
MCRRCAEKQLKQEQLKQDFAEAEAEKEDATEDSSLGSPKKPRPETEAKEKRKLKAQKALSAKIAPPTGLNSMLKSLAKPAAPALSPTKRSSEAPKKASSSSEPVVARSPAPVTGSWTAPMLTAATQPVVASGVDAVTNEAQLVAAVKGFVGQHGPGGRTSPREIARFLGTLPGAPGSGGTALDVMRARYHKLRNLLEANPKAFALHDSKGGTADADGADYDVSLASSSPSSTDLLSLMLPPVTGPVPASVEAVLEQLGLGRYTNTFAEHEFLTHDFFLCTDGESHPRQPPLPCVFLSSNAPFYLPPQMT